MTAPLPLTYRTRLPIKHPRDIIDKWIVTVDDQGAPLVSLVWKAEHSFHPRGLFEEVSEGQRNAMKLFTHSRDDTSLIHVEGEVVLADDIDINGWVEWAVYANTPHRRTAWTDPEIYAATAKISFPAFLATGVTMALLQFLGAGNLPAQVMYAPLALTCISYAAAFSSVFRTNRRQFDLHVARNLAAETVWSQSRAAQRILTNQNVVGE